MIAYLFGQLLHTFMAPFVLAWQSADLHLEQNMYLQALVGYVSSLDQFTPITDGFVPIMIVWIVSVGTPFSLYHLLLIVINAVRGAGAK